MYICALFYLYEIKKMKTPKYFKRALYINNEFVLPMFMKKKYYE